MPDQASINTSVRKHYQSVLAQDIGATFMKVDLHVHTPASGDAQAKNKYNFKFDPKEFLASMDKARTLADKIIQRCVALDIRLIAVTDHNTPSNAQREKLGNTWYELLRKAADKARKVEENAPYVLPGVEISTDDLHVLVILDPKEGPKRRSGNSRADQPAAYVEHRINALLQRCGFALEEYGDLNATGTSSMFDVLGHIEDLKVRCLAIPAHIDGDKALLDLYDRQCNVYPKLLNHPDLNAVEITKPTTPTRKSIKSKRGKSATVGAYFSRQRDSRRNPIAWIQSSDAHSIKPDGLGRRFTYVRMGQPSFTALRNALEDPRTRVRLPADYKPDSGKTVVIGMAIQQPGQPWCPIAFNPSLNCIIGKRGTRKSTVIDLLLYALERFDDDEKTEAEKRLASQHYAVDVFIAKDANVYCCRRKSAAGAPSAPTWFKLKGAAFTPLSAVPKNLVLPRKYTHEAITGRLFEKTRLMEFVDWRVFGLHSTFETALRERDKLLQAAQAVGSATVEVTTKKLRKACNALFNRRLHLPGTTVKKIMSGTKLRKVEIQLDQYGKEKDKALFRVDVTPAKRTGTKQKDYIDKARLYLRQNGKYRNIDRLDLGTRNAAIMVLLMNQGAFGPLIVDQPEQYLDVSALTGLLVWRMRQLKAVQQIICVTGDEHVLLSGDAEQVIVMRSEKQIEVLTGDTNDLKIQKQILEIFEGDADGWGLRKKNRKLAAILGSRD